MSALLQQLCIEMVTIRFLQTVSSCGICPIVSFIQINLFNMLSN